jgi:hypothetical protein
MASTTDTITIHEVEILLKDLPTKSVTLAPGKATVVRELDDVQIKVWPSFFFLALILVPFCV